MTKDAVFRAAMARFHEVVKLHGITNIRRYAATASKTAVALVNACAAFDRAGKRKKP